MIDRKRWLFVAGALVVTACFGCDFNPTAPFEGFDGRGSRISGTFDSGSSTGRAQRAQVQTDFEGIVVTVREDPSVTATVGSNGGFVLAGLPQGTVTLEFHKDGVLLGVLVFHDVLPNQEIRIVVELTDGGGVELLEEERDQAGLGECPRGAGFWCQNQGGKNPNLSAQRFEDLAADAADRLGGLLEAAEIGDAVCNTGDQLLRHLTTLALNLAAGLVDEATALVGEDYGSVGDAFEEGKRVAADPLASRGERNAIKDVLEGINESANVDGPCAIEDQDEDDDNEEPDETSPCPTDSKGKIAICHRPPGNPGNAQTLSIAPSAWPAHEAHGDSCGPCTGSP